MSSYTLPSSSTSLCPEEVALPAEAVEALTAAGTAVVVAVPLSALTCPGREGSTGAGSGGDGRSALVVAGAEAIRSGEPVAFCKVLAVAPAVLRRDGRVQAGGRPCEHARLGVLEQELDRRCGPGTIDQVAAGVRLTGKIKGKKCRELSVPFVIRATVLMTLLPEADTGEVLTALLGDLPAVPWRRPHPVPSATALSTWRAAIGPAPLQDLRRRVLTAAVAEHRGTAGGAGGAGGPAGSPAGIEVGGGLRVGAIDGTLTRMPDSKANRAAFGSTGSGDPRAGFPQLRSLHGTDAFTRTGLFTVAGPAGTDKAQAEQKLLDKAVDAHPEAFGPHQLWIMDRNFRAPRGALTYRPRSGHGLEEVSVGLMAHLDP